MVLGASAPASATENLDPATSWCAEVAENTFEQSNFHGADSYDFVCTPEKIQVEIFENGIPTGEVITDEIDSATYPAPRETQTSARGMAAASCPTQPVRKIVSEIEALISYCVQYGRKNAQTQVVEWVRSYLAQWTVYLSHTRIENRLRTTSTVVGNGQGSLWGEISLQKQNGIAPPTVLTAQDIWSDVGNPAYPFYFYPSNYGAFPDGTYAERLTKLQVTDMTKNFSATVKDPGIYTPRYLCKASVNRCYWPNKTEAPV